VAGAREGMYELTRHDRCELVFNVTSCQDSHAPRSTAVINTASSFVPVALSVTVYGIHVLIWIHHRYRVSTHLQVINIIYYYYMM
jgi:hypothetical protein